MSLPACLLALVLVLVPVLGHGQASPGAPASPIICWQEGRKLKWTDFQASTEPALEKGRIKRGHILGATTEANAVIYDRTTDSGQFVKTFVRVEFNKQKSWANNVDYFDQVGTLEHEQLHFDIIELTGRKIRRVLARCAAQHINYHMPAITKEITRIYYEEAALDDLYDKQAGYEDNPKAQARWQVQVSKQLAALRTYKSTPADCAKPD